LGFSRLFIESGINLSSNFLHHKLINNLVVFMSNRNIGNKGSKNFKKKINIYLKNIKPLQENVNLFGDKFLTYGIK